MEFLQQVLIAGLANGAVYGLVAMGFVVIFKCSGVLNFAQGYMLLFTAFVFWTFRGGFGLNVFSSVLLTLSLAFIFGMLIERLCLRPLIGQSILSLVIVTVFLVLVIEGLTTIIWGTRSLEQVSVFPVGSLKLGSANLPRDGLYMLGVASALTIIFILFFRYSRLGLAMRGVAEGHQVVQSMGISVKRILSMSWGIGGVVSALGGILLGSTVGFHLGLSYVGLMAIPAAFLGGLESPGGAVLGGLMIGLIESVVSFYVGHGAATPAAYIVLILVMLLRPYGFFGLERIERV